ncbi:MAG: hypothetical protein NZ749_12440, partial [bacterium]|nr:hypothetical protein [bacterium]
LLAARRGLQAYYTPETEEKISSTVLQEKEQDAENLDDVYVTFLQNLVRRRTMQFWRRILIVLCAFIPGILIVSTGCGGGSVGGGGDGGETPPTAQQAKEMVQLVRDTTLSAQRAGFDMEGILDSVADAQEALSRQLDATAGFTTRIEHLLRVVVSLEGEPPGVYEYRRSDRWRLYRLSAQQEGTTWSVRMEGIYNEPVQLTLRSQNPLKGLVFTPVAGGYSLNATATGLSYQGQLQMTWNPGSRDFTFRLQNATLSDPELSSPIRFTGEGTAKIAEDASAEQRTSLKEMTIAGTLNTLYGDISAQGLRMTWEPHWNEENSLTTLQANSLRLSLSARPTTAQITNVNAQLKRLPNGNLVPVVLTAEQMSLQTVASDKLDLTNLRAKFADYPSPSAPSSAALSAVSAEVLLRGMRGTYSGRVSADWLNPRPYTGDLGERLERFPKGEITFTGQFNASGITTQIENLRAVFAPDAAPPVVTIISTLRRGDKTIIAEWRSQLVQLATVEVASSTVRAEYQPSGVILRATVSGNTVRGTITTPSGATLAQIGKARDLGLPDLGDTVVIKYADDTFETLESLWLGRFRG